MTNERQQFGDIVDAADKPSAKKQLNGKSYDYGEFQLMFLNGKNVLMW